MNENIKNIETIKEFQTSINISYDLFNKNKIKTFIPTKEAISILEQLFLGVFEGNSNKARILTGAYGRGKSHIILVFLSLLREKDKKIFKNLLEKIKLYNLELYNFIFNYLQSPKKIFPVIINGGSNTLEQAFLIGLEESLKREELLDIMPETNFVSAIKVIENWEKNYKDTYKNFVLEIDEPIEKFILSLKNYELNKYKIFETVYKKLTSGAIFNPFLGTDIVELYENVNQKLREKGYQGIYVVFDEFSKYLESNLETSSIKDIKLLQDFAEKCDRNKNMNLLLITHKELNNYLSENISKEKIDSWKGISGRFLQMTLSNDFSEIYEVISLVIKKDKKFWLKFIKDNKEKFESIKNIIEKNKLIDKEKIKIIEEGCYPLHPITAFILPRLSEKIAQNERSLFTFLSANQKKSLNEFLKNDNGEFCLLTPDYLYDYFEIMLKNEVHTTTLYKNYKILRKVLTKVEKDSLEEKILKTLFLIYLVDTFESVAPTKEILIDIYKYSYENIEIIEEAIEKLEKKECILYLKRNNNQLKIKESSGIDIHKEIKKYIDKTRLTIDYIDILNKIFLNNYFYPNRYNDEKEITRYFNFKFISSQEFLSTRNWKKKIQDESADGFIFGIIYKENSEKEKIEKYIKEIIYNNSQVIFVYLDKEILIEDYIYEYYSALELKKLSENDKVLQEEYEIIIDDLEKIINNYINFYIKPENRNSNYFYNGEKQLILRKTQFSELLTKICYNNFNLTPIINNEVINKNILSSITAKSRNKVIEKILNGELEYNLGFKGNGQEIFILRTLLINTGILINTKEKMEISLREIKDKNLKMILETIEEKIKKSSLDKPLNLGEIYNYLMSIDYHIGLKKGIIPVYLTVIFYLYKEKLVIQRENKDLKITSDLLSDINETPEYYNLYLENWDIEKEKYIENLERIFNENINFLEKRYNNYRYLVDGIRRWYIGLPKYSKDIKNQYMGIEFTSKLLSKEVINLRESLKTNIENAREYLFKTVFEIFNYNEINLNIIKDIELVKIELETLVEELEYSLISDLKNIFSKKNVKEMTLLSILKDWVDLLKDNTKNHIFNKNENKFIELIENSSYNENDFIKKLAKLVTSLRLEDWNENTIKTFFDNIREIKRVIEEFDNKNEENKVENNSYKIIFTGKDGKEDIKIFEKVEFSPRAKLLFNEIENSIDEMGYSISDNEKRQVLIDILKKFC